MADARDARSEVLARIRSITGRDSVSPSAEEAWQAIPRNYKQISALSLPSCIDLLTERLEDYGAGVTRSQPAQLAATIAEILRHRNKKRMLVSPDIDAAWLPDDHDDYVFVADNALSYADIDGCDGVLTGCAVAIAGTGTLGLSHEPRAAVSVCYEHVCDQPGQGRRVLTLIPDYHLCVVRASDVVETVPEALRVLEPRKGQPITLISGPSATADIEMTRIQGVHGPRVLDVVIVD